MPLLAPEPLETAASRTVVAPGGPGGRLAKAAKRRKRRVRHQVAALRALLACSILRPPPAPAPAQPAARLLRCRWCGWVAGATNGKGQMLWKRLGQHQQRHHPTEKRKVDLWALRTTPEHLEREPWQASRVDWDVPDEARAM